MTTKRHEYIIWNAQSKSVDSVHLTHDDAELAMARREQHAPQVAYERHIIEVPAWQPPDSPHLDPQGIPVEDDPGAVKENEREIAAQQKAAAEDAKERHAADKDNLKALREREKLPETGDPHPTAVMTTTGHEAR